MEKELIEHVTGLTKAITLITSKLTEQELEINRLKAEVVHLKNLTRPYLIQKRRDTDVP